MWPSQRPPWAHSSPHSQEGISWAAYNWWVLWTKRFSGQCTKCSYMTMDKRERWLVFGTRRLTTEQVSFGVGEPQGEMWEKTCNIMDLKINITCCNVHVYSSLSYLLKLMLGWNFPYLGEEHGVWKCLLAPTWEDTLKVSVRNVMLQWTSHIFSLKKCTNQFLGLISDECLTRITSCTCHIPKTCFVF